jgi:hypothetical protein
MLPQVHGEVRDRRECASSWLSGPAPSARPTRCMTSVAVASTSARSRRARRRPPLSRSAGSASIPAAAVSRADRAVCKAISTAPRCARACGPTSRPAAAASSVRWTPRAPPYQHAATPAPRSGLSNWRQPWTAWPGRVVTAAPESRTSPARSCGGPVRDPIGCWPPLGRALVRQQLDCGGLIVPARLPGEGKGNTWHGDRRASVSSPLMRCCDAVPVVLAALTTGPSSGPPVAV